MKIIPIEGVIGWDVTETSIREALESANGGPVEFHFSSPGGLIGAGLGIGAQIRNYPGETIAVMTGYAMSMSSYLPQCCDKRVAFDDAVFMVHNARGVTWGDHNEVLKYGAYLKGLSGVVAKRLSKRSGNSLEQTTAWMDEETYFFGEEIVAAGFADEIRKSDKESDKDTALATATASFNEAVALMARESEVVKADFNKALAMNIAEIVTPPATDQLTPPAPTAGKIKQEVQQMDLQALLTANPAARSEFDAAIASARTEGEKAISATIAKVAPFLASDDYPAIVKTTAMQVLKGEEAMGTLTAAVAAVDAVREDAAAKAAAEATKEQKETLGQQHNQANPDEPVASNEALDAAIARAKGGM